QTADGTHLAHDYLLKQQYCLSYQNLRELPPKTIKFAHFIKLLSSLSVSAVVETCNHEPS
ncbi:MAG: hypothetical protein AAGD96_05965, partial [Chloroflexota bacterium]